MSTKEYPPVILSDLISEEDASRYLGRERRYLAQLQRKHPDCGPVYYQIPGPRTRRMYLVADLDKWIASLRSRAS